MCNWLWENQAINDAFPFFTQGTQHALQQFTARDQRIMNRVSQVIERQCQSPTFTRLNT